MAIRFDARTERVTYGSSSVGSGSQNIHILQDFYIDQVPGSDPGGATNYTLVRQMPASQASGTDGGFLVLLDDSDGGSANVVRGFLYNYPQSNYNRTTADAYSGATWHSYRGKLSRLFNDQEVEIDGVDVEDTQIGTNWTANTWTDDLIIGGSATTSYYDGAIGETAIFVEPGLSGLYQEMVDMWDAGWSLDVFMTELAFFAPMLTGTADLRGLVATDTGTPSPEPGKFRIVACEPQTYFPAGSGGGGGGAGIKWNATDIDWNGLTNDKWNGYA